MFHAVSEIFDGARRDFRIGSRLLAREFGFCVIAVGVLGMGIAGVTTQQTIIDSLLHRLLPFPAAERLMTVSLRHRQGLGSNGHPDAGGAIRLGDYLDVEREQHSFAQMAGYIPGSFPTRINDTWYRFGSSAVTPNFFELLGVRPVLGRDLAGVDDPDVVIISHRMWTETFGGAPDILQQTLRVGNVTRTIVGVMPEGFLFPRADDFWIPLRAIQELVEIDDVTRPLRPNIAAIGRLNPGVTPEQAQVELTLIAQRLAEAYPETNEAFTAVEVHPLAEAFMSTPFRQLLYAMFGAVVILFLVVVFNVANLQLARTARRMQEMAVRSALGATRARLVRQVLTESALVAGGGVVTGVALSWWCNRAVRQVVTSDIRGSGIAPSWAEFAFNPGLLALTIVAVSAVVMTSALVPGLYVSRAEVMPLLKTGARGSTAGIHDRLARWLVVGQIAITCPLLFGSLLMAQSFVRQERFDWGFPADVLATNRVSLRGPAYRSEEERRVFQDRLMLALEQDPLISHAALITRGPSLYQASVGSAYEVENQPVPENEPSILMLESASAGFFSTVQLPIAWGRDFLPTDVASGERVGIVNVSFARRHFSAAGAVGARFRLVGPHGKPGDWITIVGVVPDISILGPAARRPKNVPCAFLLISPVTWIPSEISIVARGPASTEIIARSLADHVARLDPDLALYGPTLTPRGHLHRVLRPRRNLTFVFCGFAFASVLLSMAGLYGVVTFSAQQRSAEIGVRMALGAERSQIMKLVLLQGVKQLSVGCGIGFALTVGLALSTRGFSSRYLYQLTALDPLSLILTGVLLAGATLVACWAPASRATRIKPVEALRME